MTRFPIGLTATLVALMSILGCQSTGSPEDGTAPGSGPVVMSALSFKEFQEYMDNFHPLVFALSKSGKTSFATTCYSGACSVGDNRKYTLILCEARSNGEPCSIFAERRRIVWQNPGNFEPEDKTVPVQPKQTYVPPEANPALAHMPKPYRTLAVRLQTIGLFRKYAALPAHKAYAAAWNDPRSPVRNSYFYGAPTVQDAIDGALRDCRKRNVTVLNPCQVVSINGHWVGGTSTEDLIANADAYAQTDGALLEGHRVMQLTWQDVATDYRTTVAYRTSGGSGEFSFELERGGASELCAGTFKLQDKDTGQFDLTCAGGRSATGVLKRVDGSNTFRGTGKDLNDGSLEFRIGDHLG